MAEKRGAKCKYETCVKPYLAEINQKIREGITEKAIASSLGITEQTLNNYKKQYPELAEALSKGKGADVLQDLINAGIEAAKGCYKTNTQTYYKMDEYGNPVIEKVIEFEQWQQPNATLNKYYVNNFGKEQEFANDPLDYKLKKAKQEFSEKLEKAKNWHLNLDK